MYFEDFSLSDLLKTNYQFGYFSHIIHQSLEHCIRTPINLFIIAIKLYYSVLFNTIQNLNNCVKNVKNQLKVLLGWKCLRKTYLSKRNRRKVMETATISANVLNFRTSESKLLNPSTNLTCCWSAKNLKEWNWNSFQPSAFIRSGNARRWCYLRGFVHLQDVYEKNTFQHNKYQKLAPDITKMY